MLASYFFPDQSGTMTHAAATARPLATGLLDWSVLSCVRENWTGALVVKGILNPNDAVRVADLGVDGITISNHDGRQLDAAPATIEVLPAIRAAVGDRIKLLIDSGVRTGDDIVKSIAFGADFVLPGKPIFLAAAACGGQESARRSWSGLSVPRVDPVSDFQPGMPGGRHQSAHDNG